VSEGRSGRKAGQVDPAPTFPVRGLVGVLLGVTILFALYLLRTDFHLFPRHDVMETVLTAHQLADGEGFTARVTFPSVLAFLEQQGRSTEPPWPNLLRSPLPQIVMAGLMRVTSESMAIALYSGTFFILAAGAVFLVAHRLAGEMAGLLAATTFALSQSGLWYGASGLNESSTIFALAAITWLLMGELTWGGCLAAGIIAGIGYLGRSTFEIWAPVIIAFIVWRSWRSGWLRAGGRALAFAAPLALAIVWWGLTIHAMTGDFAASGQEELVIRMDSGLYPGRSGPLVFEHWSALEFIREHPYAMASKYARHAERLWPIFPEVGAMTLLMGFFVVEAVIVFAGGKRAGVHWLVYALLGVQLLIAPIVVEGTGGPTISRYLDPLGVVATTLGAAFAVELLRRYGVDMRRAVWPLVAIVLLTATPTIVDFVVGRYHDEDIREAREIAAVLQKLGDSDDVVASSYPGTVAWASGVYAVSLPLTPDQMPRLQELVDVEWIYVEPRHGITRERTTAWLPVIAGEQQVPGFAIVRRFGPHAVLLRRIDAP